jgi:hypothetical protein
VGEDSDSERVELNFTGNGIGSSEVGPLESPRQCGDWARLITNLVIFTPRATNGWWPMWN